MAAAQRKAQDTDPIINLEMAARTLRDWCHLHGICHRVVGRTPGQRGFVVVEKRWVVERTFRPLAHWGGLLRSRAGRLEVDTARLACAAVLSGVEALAKSKEILKTAA